MLRPDTGQPMLPSLQSSRATINGVRDLQVLGEAVF